MNSDWTCECGELNFKSRSECRKCKKQNKTNIKPGDWVCSCGIINFTKRKSCYKCNKLKNNGPTFKEGDWYCGSCNKLNFKSRQKCYICGWVKKEQIKELNNVFDECVVCMDKKKNYIIIKCGHLCFCEDCGKNLTVCPMCRVDYDPNNDLLKVYT